MSLRPPPHTKPLVASTVPVPYKPQYDVYAHYGRHLIQDRLEQQKSKLQGRAQAPTPVPHLGSLIVQHRTPVVTLDPYLPIGILGAGVGGLYTALMLKSVGIPYEIIEASNRTGGRLFTYKFPTGSQFDYYDVGAMRFPDTDVMTRLYHLFQHLRLDDKLVPYIFDSPQCFLLFNGIRARQNTSGNTFRAEDVKVPLPYIELGYEEIVNQIVKPFADTLQKDLKSGGKAGWEMLKANDAHSARSYMSFAFNGPQWPTWDLPSGGLPTNVVNWCETMANSTGSFERSLAETVLDEIAFGYPNPDEVKWKCISGGSQVLSDTMTALIPADVMFFNQQVTGIAPADPNDKNSSMNVTVASGPTRAYSHVISTLPLPCLRTLDLSGCNLEPMQSNALRELTYGPSVKVGIQFQSAWWTDGFTKDGERIDIVGGQSRTDLPIRCIVYPSYGGAGVSAVLLASYSWTDDAARLGALVKTGQSGLNNQLKALVMRDLAAVHNVDVQMLNAYYVDLFAFDWDQDPYTMGAFAFFGPGKFGDLYEYMNLPAAGGRLHFAGEALSTRHAWVVGALDSAWRAVAELLIISRPDLLGQFYELWGHNLEWVTEELPGVRHNFIEDHIRGHFPELF